MKITKQRLVQIIKEEMEAYDRRDVIDPEEFTSAGKDTTAEFEQVGALEQFIANLKDKMDDKSDDEVSPDELAGIIIQSLKDAGYDVDKLR
jgi:hypothetical protein